MRKITIILILAIALLLSCDRHVLVDYGYSESYQVENLTDESVSVVRGQSGDIIPPGGKEEIYEIFGLGGESSEPMPDNRNDGYWPSDRLQNWTIYVGNRQLNKEVLNPNNWKYLPEGYYHTNYLLSITDALVESVGYVEEEECISLPYHNNIGEKSNSLRC
jgi:hypothetical protein